MLVESLTDVPLISKDAYPDIREGLYRWWVKNKRFFPWREKGDPYSIFVAEFMLQKTQVAKVERVYSRFLEEFPSIQELANASEQELLRTFAWLGLVKRVGYILRSAQLILIDYKGQIPSSPDVLIKLPGVGKYTANAVASFSYNQAFPIVDSTIARVLKRLLGYRTLKDAWEDKTTWQIAGEFLDKTNSARHNYALIDFAALVCTPRDPLCDKCPLNHWCIQYRGSFLEGSQ